jgi:hypothetical protein
VYSENVLQVRHEIWDVHTDVGHSSIKMTVDTYGHWIPGTNRAAVNRLPSLKTSVAKTAAS